MTRQLRVKHTQPTVYYSERVGIKHGAATVPKRDARLSRLKMRDASALCVRQHLAYVDEQVFGSPVLQHHVFVSGDFDQRAAVAVIDGRFSERPLAIPRVRLYVHKDSPVEPDVDRMMITIVVAILVSQPPLDQPVDDDA